VIAATNQDLAELVRQKRFRQDLFFRLNVVSLTIPALRDRREDVIPLADYFLQQFCRHARRNTPQLSTAARQQLENHRWPGNVRELRNVIERLAYLSSGDIIDVDDLTFMIAPAEHAAISVQTVGLSLTDATAQFQSDYVRHAIDQADGNVAAAAKQLGLHRSNMSDSLNRANGMQANRRNC
jgi:Nif-specific regulatory protein